MFSQSIVSDPYLPMHTHSRYLVYLYRVHVNFLSFRSFILPLNSFLSQLFITNLAFQFIHTDIGERV